MIEIINDSGEPVNEHEFADLARFVFGRMHLDPATELSIRFVEPEEMANLHEQWLDLPGPTDVMSFPMDEMVPGMPGSPSGPGMLGDIALCPEVTRAQAAEAGHPQRHEDILLTIHGILHLLGYDHAEPGEKKEMFDLQRTLMEEFLELHP